MTDHPRTGAGETEAIAVDLFAVVRETIAHTDKFGPRDWDSHARAIAERIAPVLTILRTRLEEAERDAERFRWLALQEWWAPNRWDRERETNIRHAVDAAMSTPSKEQDHDKR